MLPIYYQVYLHYWNILHDDGKGVSSRNRSTMKKFIIVESSFWKWVFSHLPKYPDVWHIDLSQIWTCCLPLAYFPF